MTSINRNSFGWSSIDLDMEVSIEINAPMVVQLRGQRQGISSINSHAWILTRISNLLPKTGQSWLRPFEELNTLEPCQLDARDWDGFISLDSHKRMEIGRNKESTTSSPMSRAST